MYEDAVAQAEAAGVVPSKDGNIQQFFDVSNVSEKARQLHGWLKCIMEKTCP